MPIGVSIFSFRFVHQIKAVISALVIQQRWCVLSLGGSEIGAQVTSNIIVLPCLKSFIFKTNKWLRLGSGEQRLFPSQEGRFPPLPQTDLHSFLCHSPSFQSNNTY
ncbi:hypothetical protein V6N13_075845 [Hibiscus sabdariffa]